MDLKRTVIVVLIGLVIGGVVFGAMLLLNPAPPPKAPPVPAVAPDLPPAPVALIKAARSTLVTPVAFLDPAKPNVRQAAKFVAGKQATAMAFTRDGRLLVCIDYLDAHVRVLDWRTGTVVSQAKHGYLLASMALAPDDSGLWTGDAYQHLYWWPLDKDGHLGQPDLVGENLGGHPGLAVSPNGALLATASYEKVISLWDTAARKQLARIEADEPLRTCVFSPDGATLLVGTASSHLYIYDLATGKGPKVRVPPVQELVDITALVFSADGRHLATGHTQPWVTIWDARNMTYRHWLKCPMAGVCDVAFSPDSTLVAFALGNHELHLWNPDIEAESGGVAVLKGHEKFIHCLAFSPDGRLLASGDDSGAVVVWTKGE